MNLPIVLGWAIGFLANDWRAVAPRAFPGRALFSPQPSYLNSQLPSPRYLLAFICSSPVIERAADLRLSRPLVHAALLTAWVFCFS